MIHQVGPRKTLTSTDGIVQAVNVAFSGEARSVSAPPAGVQRTILTREILKAQATPEKVAQIAGDLAEEGRKHGLKYFTEVEVTEQSMGNRLGQPQSYLFKVYGASE